VNAIWMDSTTLAIEYLVCLSVRRYLFLLDSFNEVLSYLSTMLYIAAWTAVISVTEVNLARVPRALEGEVKGVVASRGRVRGGCGVKVAVRG